MKLLPIVGLLVSETEGGTAFFTAWVDGWMDGSTSLYYISLSLGFGNIYRYI